MKIFDNFKRVRSAGKAARLEKENEIIESDKYYSLEDRNKLLNNAEKLARNKEQNKIYTEKANAKNSQKIAEKGATRNTKVENTVNSHKETTYGVKTGDIKVETHKQVNKTQASKPPKKK